MSKNEKLLKSFTEYCRVHPSLRFWQALRNWCGWNFVYVTRNIIDDGEDTFYWEDNQIP